MPDRASQVKKSHWLIVKKKIEQGDNMYNVANPKVNNFKLTADSNSMGFAAFLKDEFLGLKLSEEQ